MKKLLFLVTLMAAMNVNTYAYNVRYGDNSVCYQNASGTKLICNSGTVPSIKYSGDVILNGTTVSGDTHVSGDLSANCANLNRLSVSGNSDLANTTVVGDGHFSGNVRVRDNSLFKSSVNISGNLQARSSNFDSVEVHGNLIASTSNFNKFVIHGDINVAESKFLSIGSISGSLASTNSKFLKDIRVAGDIYSDNTEFCGKLTVSTTRSIFKSSLTKDIIDTYMGTKVRNIYLQDKTTVDGSITFKYGDKDKNIVHKEASTITGHIINGIMVNAIVV